MSEASDRACARTVTTTRSTAVRGLGRGRPVRPAGAPLRWLLRRARAAAAETRAAPRASPPSATTPKLPGRYRVLGALVDGADLTLRVPTCRTRTLRQLATHVGRVQRWVTWIVQHPVRPSHRLPATSPDGRIPDDPAEHAGWLRAGARTG